MGDSNLTISLYNEHDKTCGCKSTPKCTPTPSCSKSGQFGLNTRWQKNEEIKGSTTYVLLSSTKEFNNLFKLNAQTHYYQAISRNCLLSTIRPALQDRVLRCPATVYEPGVDPIDLDTRSTSQEWRNNCDFALAAFGVYFRHLVAKPLPFGPHVLLRPSSSLRRS